MATKAEIAAANKKAEKKAKGSAKKSDKKSGKDKKGGDSKFKVWFKNMIAELKKITWTSRSDTFKNTLVVLLVVLVVGIGVWVADALLVKLREVVYAKSVAQAAEEAEAAIIYFRAMISPWL